MGLYQVNMIAGLDNGKDMSWHFDLESPVNLNDGQLDSIIDDAFTEYKTHVALFTADVALTRATIFGFQRAGAGTEEDPYRREKTTVEHVTTSAGADGTAAGQALPPQNAFVISFRTNQPGRRFFGRAYTPPPPESVVGADGIVSDATSRIAMVQQVIEAAEGSIPPTDVDHIVYSLKYDEQAEVTVYNAGSRIDTQRRRLQRTPR